MNIEKTHESKSKDSFPNFYPFSKNLEIALETSNSTFEFLDNKFPEENKGLPKKLNPLKISESFSLDHLKNLIYDFAYFSMESIYFIALISSNLITFLDLPKKPNSSFMLRETIIIELIEKKNKVIDNALEGVFKVPSLEKEFLNCCEFGYKIRSNNSKLLFLESETDLVLACGSRSGLIYIVTINESFEINYLYGHINEIYSLKFATPNQTFNFQNILISGSKDGSMILWNIHNEAKIAIFSPKQNPNSDVLSVSWAPHCDYIVSVGLESMVKVWTVSPKLKRKIEKSHSLNNQNVGSFKKMEINLESYKNNEAHKNFEFQIDQIEFYGYSFLSKDAFGNIVFWIPNFENEGCIVFKNFNSQQLFPNFFIKFSFSVDLGIIAIGNDQGEIFIYDFLNVNKNSKNENGLARKYELERDKTLIRKVIITEDKNILFVISDKKKLYKFDLMSDLELIEKVKLRNLTLGKK